MAQPSVRLLKERPVLLVDVDGVISLFGFERRSPPPGRLAVVDGLPHYLSEQAGVLLTRLAARSSASGARAGRTARPSTCPTCSASISRPSRTSPSRGARPRAGRHWKLDAIDAHTGRERPVAWIDDGHDDRTRDWAADRPGPTLLVRTEPAVGITEDQVEELEAWAARLRRP